MPSRAPLSRAFVWSLVWRIRADSQSQLFIKSTQVPRVLQKFTLHDVLGSETFPFLFLAKTVLGSLHVTSKHPRPTDSPTDKPTTWLICLYGSLPFIYHHAVGY
ncbi:hypothetical protein FB451DRAFT_332373 [Mycena latifolia]|nr:hypothetical protein FB451DRAFT_332373 [Mycena latifolia]